jgi:hypothetical protein
VFWEQTGLQVTHKITISRGVEAAYPAFKKHFEELIGRYSNIHVVNLLSQKDSSGEFQLGNLFRQAISKLSVETKQIEYTSFDYHSIVGRENYNRVRCHLSNSPSFQIS